MTLETFTVNSDHIRLLQRLNIIWDNSEAVLGVLSIDPKRPYGNTDIYEDISSIVSFPTGLINNEDNEKYSPTEKLHMRALHLEMKIVLQILIDNLSIIPGEYIKTSIKWVAKPSTPDEYQLFSKPNIGNEVWFK